MTQVGVICEQGDLGLHYDPLKEADQKKYEKQQQDEANKKDVNKK